MGKKKILILIVVGALLIGRMTTAGASDDVIRQWQSFTSFNEVTDMAMYPYETFENAIWVSTTGGLLVLDPALIPAPTLNGFNNANGLGTNRLNCLCVDDLNRLWVGGRGRLINFADPENPDAYLFTDRDNNLIEIYDIACTPGGDSLWLANSLGVTLFLPGDQPGDGLILDTYTRFGDIERDIPAVSVALGENTIWVGTGQGFASGDRADVRLLKSPANWQSYFPGDLNAAIPNDTVRCLAMLHDTLYVGTTAGLYLLDTDPAPGLTSLNLFGAPLVYNMSLNGDSLIASTARGTIIFADGLWGQYFEKGMPITNSTAAIIDTDGLLWNGNLLFGCYYQVADSLVSIDVGVTPSNRCEAITEAMGKLWGAFGDAGLAILVHDEAWGKIEGISGSVISLATGPLGELWVGTFGNGVYRITENGTWEFDIQHFDTSNSALSGVSENPAFVVVPDIYATPDAIWMADYRGIDGEVVAVNPYNTDQWEDYRFIGGANAELMNTVTVGQDVLYAGSENNGIYVVLHSGTPFYTGDDYRTTLTSSNSGIGSDIIKYMRIDGFDSLWVGTSYGLSYQALGEVIFDNVTLPEGFGPETTCLDFDGQGSLYAGSQRGMVIRDIATGKFTYFTSTNSDLVDDDILDIYYQKSTGDIWISTTGGISRLTMTYQLATRDVDEVLAYPNPFVIANGSERLRFNFDGIGQINIFTIAGELVRDIPYTGEWDGTNNNGQSVASGVYLFTITDRDGNTGRGKIFLVRQ